MEFLGLVAGLLGLDLFLKGKIEAQEAETFPRDLEGTQGKIRLYQNHNGGFCFGKLKEKTELVKQLPLVFTSASAGIFVWVLTRKSRFADRLGISLITAGGLSNLYDRMKRGYVVDYFSIRVKWLEKVVLNLGDVCILAGTLLLSVSGLIGDGDGRSEKCPGSRLKSLFSGRKSRKEEAGEQ